MRQTLADRFEAKGGAKGAGTSLARKFGVSKSAIYAIWVGKNWQK